MIQYKKHKASDEDEDVYEDIDTSDITFEDQDKGNTITSDEHHLQEEEDRYLPLWRKLCFAVGGMPYQMTVTVIGFFLNIFLLEVAEVKYLFHF